MGEEQEIRMKRHNEDMESRVKRALKGFLEDLKGFFGCRSVHPRGVYSPAPRRTPAPETRDSDDGQPDDGGPVVGDVSPHDDEPLQVPHRHSVHEYGSTSTSHHEQPHFSLQNPSDYNFDPRYMEHVAQGLMSGMGVVTTEGLQNLLFDHFQTPAMPRRSERQRFPSRLLDSPYLATGEPCLLPKKVVDKFMEYMNGREEYVFITESSVKYKKGYFHDILRLNFSFPEEVVELFMLSCKSRLMTGGNLLPNVTSKSTVISSLDLFRVCQTYWRCCMFGTKLNLVVPGTYDSFAAWEVPEGICKMIKGECGSSVAQSWMGASQNTDESKQYAQQMCHNQLEQTHAPLLLHHPHLLHHQCLLMEHTLHHHYYQQTNQNLSCGLRWAPRMTWAEEGAHK
ncbi:uncharacterized protein LOC131011054 isoform X1 [Salvia miltiorrhiza]|uniref:uncharacterized protein LOC131011054 isoform X1 n=1 Tax=Salvia miltiorrhiza TaxID=226208 RepID=UPI0025AC4D2D|nr:uncharacterized protein LOC131011054 isoform X1 [Salvia miltiorrhiza]